MTAFAAIQTAIVSALGQSPSLADGRVFANRGRAVPQQAGSYIVVRTDQAVGTETVLGFHDWQTIFAVEIYTRGATGAADPVLAVDALLSAAWSRLCAIGPEAIGAMQIVPQPRIEWITDEAETSMVCAVLRVMAMHRTPFNSLESS